MTGIMSFPSSDSLSILLHFSSYIAFLSIVIQGDPNPGWTLPHQWVFSVLIWQEAGAWAGSVLETEKHE